VVGLLSSSAVLVVSARSMARNAVDHTRRKPATVIVDPRLSFGLPRFGRAGPRLIDVAGMLEAGEDPAVVAYEFGISTREVAIAARILLGARGSAVAG
jgi:hypothetical protein